MAGIVISFGDSYKISRDEKGKSLLSFPDDYVVVDIETTGLDPHFDEIIELAAIKYENNQEVSWFQSLVKPENEIDEFITELTGITNEMLTNSPSISSVLPEFRAFIGSSTIIGHNVNFDINFIYDFSKYQSLPPFTNDFVDTMRLSRRLYKDMPNHKLQSLVTYLGVADTVEHRALADCISTQLCYLTMKKQVQESGASLIADWEHYNSMAKSIKAETDEFNQDSPIFGRSFAFTGKLELMTRKEAMQAVVNAGGICCDGVIASTNYLVLGNSDYCKSIKGGKSSKQKKAEKMQLNGADIQTISEDVFYDMLSLVGTTASH